MFIRGCILRQMDRISDAIECFNYVIENSHTVDIFKHLAPQACYELGDIYRNGRDYSKAKFWLKETKKYTNYFTEMMISYRVELSLKLIKKL